MKISKRLLAKYNRKEAVLVVTSYPSRGGESAKQNAVANYARELVDELGKLTPVVVVCEVVDKPKIYEENGVLVVRAYQKGSYGLSRQILDAVGMFDAIEMVQVQFEFNIFGGMSVTASSLAMFAGLKTLGKKVTLGLHQVVDDLEELSGHVGITGGSLKFWVLNQGMRWFYRTIAKMVDAIVVHDEFLKEKLKRYVSVHKVSVVPHGVSKVVRKVGRRAARKKLGVNVNETLVVSFGYVSWYKGTDWIARKMIKMAEKYPERKFRLMLAGGYSPTMSGKAHFEKFRQDLERLLEKAKGVVEVAGYVPDNEKYLYFEAADIVVYPYRARMSASGAMSHALAYGKPILVSEARFADLLESDLKEEMKNVDIAPEELVFFMQNGSFDRKILNLLENKSKMKKLGLALSRTAKARSWKNVANLYLKVMHKGYIAQGKEGVSSAEKLNELSVFFPLYNEEDNVVSLVRQAVAVLPRIAGKFEIVLVDDGSTDNTLVKARELARIYPEVRIVTQENMGYGGAVKRGLKEAKYDWVFYTDGDLQFDLGELEQFIAYSRLHDIVIGYRVNRAEGVSRSVIASLLKVWNKILLGFPLQVRDIDCAFKLINKKVIDGIGELECNGAMVTTEFLLKAYREGYSMTQLGVNHYKRRAGKSTGASIKVIWKAVTETFKLRKQMKNNSYSKRVAFGRLAT